MAQQLYKGALNGACLNLAKCVLITDNGVSNDIVETLATYREISVERQQQSLGSKATMQSNGKRAAEDVSIPSNNATGDRIVAVSQHVKNRLDTRKSATGSRSTPNCATGFCVVDVIGPEIPRQRLKLTLVPKECPSEGHARVGVVDLLRYMSWCRSTDCRPNLSAVSRHVNAPCIARIDQPLRDACDRPGAAHSS